MYSVQLTIFRDGYNDIRSYREDQLNYVDGDITKCLAKGYEFNLEIIEETE